MTRWCVKNSTRHSKRSSRKNKKSPALDEVETNQATLEDFDLTSDEVKRNLLELNVTKVAGPDRISLWILKKGAEELSVSLPMVYNRPLVMEDLPESWKTANVVPEFKKDEKQETLNYRPVSLTCIPCKEMEKIVRKRQL
ncbi:uncharacterized protein [Procambarus clarkii]|uniref:uncharacterized protein n=1 Tax=Procambarus clarkii TaxID=6728 RepID=UPI0037447FE0